MLYAENEDCEREISCFNIIGQKHTDDSATPDKKSSFFGVWKVSGNFRTGKIYDNFEVLLCRPNIGLFLSFL